MRGTCFAFTFYWEEREDLEDTLKGNTAKFTIPFKVSLSVIHDWYFFAVSSEVNSIILARLTYSPTVKADNGFFGVGREDDLECLVINKLFASMLSKWFASKVKTWKGIRSCISRVQRHIEIRKRSPGCFVQNVNSTARNDSTILQKTLFILS